MVDKSNNCTLNYCIYEYIGVGCVFVTDFSKIYDIAEKYFKDHICSEVCR